MRYGRLKQRHHHALRQKRSAYGFALVATLLLLTLLVALVLVLLGLVRIETSTTRTQQEIALARHNALTALDIAIGELQTHTGADTRVTAPANIYDPAFPDVIGAWKSWEGLNHDANGRPIAPDYALKDQASTSGNGRFITWLVSGANVGQNFSDPGSLLFNDPASASGVDTVPLLSKGSLGPNSGREIHVPKQLLNNAYNRGAYAWWVSAENQKARIAQPYAPRSSDPEDLIELGQSYPVPDPEAYGLEVTDLGDPESFIPNGTATGMARKALNLPALSILRAGNTVEPENKFHDFSTTAVGLLTNTATGGWRKDLSLLTEKWDDIYNSYPGGELPLFRFSPVAGDTSLVPKPTVTNYSPPQCTLYPWSEYSVLIGTRWPATFHAAASSWQSLANFATAYKNFTYTNGVAESPFVWDIISGRTSPTNQEFYNYKHRQRLYPQIARFQFLVYAKTKPNVARPERFDLFLVYVPIFTLWNPYNVRLTIDNPGAPIGGIVLGARRGLPGALAVVSQATYPDPSLVPGTEYRLVSNGNFQYLDVGGNFWNQYDTNIQENIDRFMLSGSEAARWVDMRTIGGNLPTGGQIVFEPGEVRMFSPDGRIESRFGGTGFGLEPGYSPELVEGREIQVAGNLTGNQAYWFLWRNDKFTQPYRYRSPGVGFSLSYGINNSTSYTGGQLYSSVESEYHNITALANGAIAEIYWPQDEVDEVGYSISAIASVPAMPLFSVSMGPRFTIGTGVGTPQNRPTKGLVQSDPLAAMTIMDPGSSNLEAHPVNGAFDMSYHSLSIGSTITPNLSDSKGFIATGYQSGDGLSRLITHEIPLRPMASLVELQSWNPRGHNPYPPFQSNLIGNSDANPLIPRNNVVPATMNPNSIEYNLQHDDAYCANHLLFDDWFVSSIAPQPLNLGGTIAKDIDTFYKDILMGTDILSNRAYLPIHDDRYLSSVEADTRVAEIINSPDGSGWLKVASRLVVDGMFNVNSTSTDAWKAILGHAKSRAEIGLYGQNGIVSTTPTGDHPVTRGAVASDVEADSDTAIGGGFGNASDYTGFRSLTDSQIEDLANKIVEQVRLRGPFLSLAEFVNRQLTDNNDLALAGALQTAINNLSTDPMATLRDPANMLSDDTMELSDPMLGGAGYVFNEAAQGSSAYGAPGWIRQADILRPIAPILSARDDTFTIRTYGDARDQAGNIAARTWCEATVQRSREFVDPADAADAIETPGSTVNQRFGRKYIIKSIRWLSPGEV